MHIFKYSSDADIKSKYVTLQPLYWTALCAYTIHTPGLCRFYQIFLHLNGTFFGNKTDYAVIFIQTICHLKIMCSGEEDRSWPGKDVSAP